jgi:dihydroneopterin aldolase
MKSQATIELCDLKLVTQIGTYGPLDVKPDIHLLNLVLQIDTNKVLISADEMQYVFDYDPLIKEIDRLASDRLYETQEHLMTRIAHACVAYREIKAVEICLRKAPVLNGSGSLGVRLILCEASTNALRNMPLFNC